MIYQPTSSAKKLISTSTDWNPHRREAIPYSLQGRSAVQGKESVATLSRITVDRIEVSTYAVPTDLPESDGTLEWNSTTLVLVHAHGGNEVGLGYTYADTATATLIRDLLSKVVKGGDAMAPTQTWNAMVSRIRNLGRPGIASMAISAVDIALWDLKAHLLNVPLLTLFGAVRNAVPIYGSGGFTSYSDKQLQRQFSGWVAQGITRVKMKIGRNARADVERVREARTAIGVEAQLFVDANGAQGAPLPDDRFAYHAIDSKGQPLKSIEYKELNLNARWESFDIRHELTAKGIQKFVADYEGTLRKTA